MLSSSYLQHQKADYKANSRLEDGSDLETVDLSAPQAPGPSTPSFQLSGVEIVQITRLKDSSGGTWSKPRVSTEIDRGDSIDLRSGVGSSRTHMLASGDEGLQQTRQVPPGVLKHSSSSSTNLHAACESVPKSVRFLEPPISPETWKNTAERLPLLLEQAEMDAEIDRLQQRLADSIEWCDTWRISSQKMIAARGSEIEIAKQRIARERENYLALIEQEHQIYQEAYKMLGGKEDN